jgi:hypothetical protein
MKKIILTIATLLFLVTTSSAQINPWFGFKLPIKSVVKADLAELKKMNKLTVNSDTVVINPTTFFIVRPSVVATLAAIDFSQTPAKFTSLSFVGFGLSLGKYSADDKAYCYYSVNGLVLTSIKIGDTETAKLGFAVTADVYNKLFGGGIGYINGHVMPLITMSYSF